MNWLLFYQQATEVMYFWNGEMVICVNPGDNKPLWDDAIPDRFSVEGTNATQLERTILTAASQESSRVKVMNIKPRGKFTVVKRGIFTPTKEEDT